MPTVELLGGKVQIYQRGNSRFWQARASVGGKQRQFSTKQEGQELAAKAAAAHQPLVIKRSIYYYLTDGTPPYTR